jgi:hypothetical protein
MTPQMKYVFQGKMHLSESDVTQQEQKHEKKKNILLLTIHLYKKHVRTYTKSKSGCVYL